MERSSNEDAVNGRAAKPAVVAQRDGCKLPWSPSLAPYLEDGRPFSATSTRGPVEDDFIVPAPWSPSPRPISRPRRPPPFEVAAAGTPGFGPGLRSASAALHSLKPCGDARREAGLAPADRQPWARRRPPVDDARRRVTAKVRSRGWPARYFPIISAARRPAFIGLDHPAGPETASPPANTPRREVMSVAASTVIPPPGPAATLWPRGRGVGGFARGKDQRVQGGFEFRSLGRGVRSGAGADFRQTGPPVCPAWRDLTGSGLEPEIDALAAAWASHPGRREVRSSRSGRRR